MLRNVFISYKRGGSDEAFATRLESDFVKLGVTVWRDRKKIAPGDAWDRALVRGIAGCKEFLLVLSLDSVESEHVVNELHRAWKLGKRIIPLLLEECEKPLLIERTEHVDFTGSYERSLAALMGWPVPPLTSLDEVKRLLRRARRWWMLLPLVILLIVAMYWRFAPSRTSLSVAGVTLDGAAIVVRVENEGGRASALGSSRLVFPAEVPIREQELRYVAGSPRIIPGHDVREIQLTAPGLQPLPLSDGSYRNNTEVAALLPRHKATLTIWIEESGATQARAHAFPAERIRKFVLRKYPRVVPGGNDEE